MNTPLIFLVFGFLLVYPGFADTGAKNELHCTVDPKDLKNLKEALENVRVKFVAMNIGYIYKLSDISREFRKRKGSSDECEATVINLFNAFIDQVTEIIDLNTDTNVEDRIQDVENTRNRFAMQVENEKGMTLSKLKTFRVRLEVDRELLESARDKLLSLEDSDELIKNLVTETYSGDLYKLKNVIYFVSKINHDSVAAKGLTTLFQEMKRHKHTREKEMILMHYELERIMAQVDSPNHELLIKYQLTDLSRKTRPVVKISFRDLENDFYAQNYKKTLQTVTFLAQSEQKLFVVDLAKQLFLNANCTRSFRSFMKFGTQLPLEVSCHYAQEIFRQLEHIAATGSMLGLQLWSFLQNVLHKYEYNRTKDPRLQTCKAVHQKLDSTKAKYLEEYASSINLKNKHQTLYSWHKEDPDVMKHFLARIVIPYLGDWRFTNLDDFLILNKYIKNLPSSDVICEALRYIQLRITDHGLFLKTQNLLNLKVSNQQPGGCFAFGQNEPRVFQYLLSTSTRKCKLTTTYKQGYEKMYCPGSYANKYDNQDRPVSTMPNSFGDEYWDISINDDGYVTFRNTFYGDRYLTTFSNNDLAWAVRNYPESKFWHIEAYNFSAQYIKITSHNTYLYVSNELSESSTRMVKLRNGPADPEDEVDVWWITC